MPGLTGHPSPPPDPPRKQCHGRCAVAASLWRPTLRYGFLVVLRQRGKRANSAAPQTCAFDAEYGATSPPCAPYMDASRVAREIFEVLTLRVNCGLISGLLVQTGLSPTAGPDGDSRGRSSSQRRASHKACPGSATALPTHGLTALPSLL